MGWRQRLREVRGLFGLPVDDADAYMRRAHRSRRPPTMPPIRHVPDDAGPPPPFRASRLRRYRDLFEDAAGTLLERQSVDVETNAGTPLRARLRRFDDGTAVFEYEFSSPHGGSEGTTRLEPEHLRASTIAHNLEFAFLNSRVRPVRNQPT